MIIGITGSFGSGKTTVAKMFGRLGACVIDADKVCHLLMKPSTRLHRRVVRIFGNAILKKDKQIDRKRLADIVFASKTRLRLLNEAVHPNAIREIMKIARREKRTKTVVIDAPLLVESGLHKKMDKIIVVKNRLTTQISRLNKATGLKRKDVLQRIRMQASIQKKLKLADFVIDNSISKEKTLFQVQEIWKKITR